MIDIRRKMMVLLIAALIFCSTGTMAENATIPNIRETVTAETNAFQFRNGVTWGMNPQQVQATEQTAMDLYSSGDWSVLISAEPAEVSRFTADLVFMFRKDLLQMITYEFQTNGSGLNFQYLTGALCAVYGENYEADAGMIKGFMDQIYPDRYNIGAITRASGWTAKDGTMIFQYYFSADQFAILYVNPGLGQQSGGYMINGL